MSPHNMHRAVNRYHHGICTACVALQHDYFASYTFCPLLSTNSSFYQTMQVTRLPNLMAREQVLPTSGQHDLLVLLEYTPNLLLSLHTSNNFSRQIARILQRRIRTRTQNGIMLCAASPINVTLPAGKLSGGTNSRNLSGGAFIP